MPCTRIRRAVAVALDTNWAIYGLLAAIIASVHVWIGWFERRFDRFEAHWMGFVGGIAVGYVTLYMLPKLSRITFNYMTSPPDDYAYLFQYRAYVILLAGLIAYMMVESASRAGDVGRAAAGWIEAALIALYSFLIGYVAVELPPAQIYLHVLANVTLALHLMGMLHHLRVHHPHTHQGWRGWVYAALVFFGYGVGVVSELPDAFVVGVTAFLAGIILVNVMSDELPKGKEGRMPMFLVGVGCFLVVTLVITEQ